MIIFVVPLSSNHRGSRRYKNVLLLLLIDVYLILMNTIEED